MKIQLIILIFQLVLIQSCKAETLNLSTDLEQRNAMLMPVLKNALLTTPYVAIIQKIRVDIVAVPDSDLSDEYAEEQHIYHAKVLETFQGQEFKNISYIMLVEKGETAVIDDAPVIISLCLYHGKFYWPGVGSQFPVTEEGVAVARRISQENKQRHIQCDGIP